MVDGLGSFISRVRVGDAKFWSSQETSERLLERKKGGAGARIIISYSMSYDFNYQLRSGLRKKGAIFGMQNSPFTASLNL